MRNIKRKREKKKLRRENEDRTDQVQKRGALSKILLRTVRRCKATKVELFPERKVTPLPKWSSLEEPR